MSLTISGITLGSDQLALTPAFDPQKNEYTVDVPSDVTSITVTFTKAVYDTVWGGADASSSGKCKVPVRIKYLPPPGTMAVGTWTQGEYYPTEQALHADTYTPNPLNFTGSQSDAGGAVMEVSIFDGTTVKTTTITFNRVSA